MFLTEEKEEIIDLTKQIYSVLSLCVSPIDDTFVALKPFGSFEIENEANEFCKNLQSSDNLYDFYVLKNNMFGYIYPKEKSNIDESDDNDKLDELLKKTTKINKNEQKIFEKNEMDKDMFKEESEEDKEKIKYLNPQYKFGLLDELPQEEVDKIEEKVNERLEKESNIDINLEENPELTVEDHEFMLVSFAGPNLKQKAKENQMKILGFFNNVEVASNYAQKIQKEEGEYDIYLLQSGYWNLIPPSSDLQDPKKRDDTLNNVIHEYKKMLIYKEEYFEIRKNYLMKNKVVNVRYEALKKVLYPTFLSCVCKRYIVHVNKNALKIQSVIRGYNTRKQLK